MLTSIEVDGVACDKDMATLVRMIEKSLYMRVEAVKNVVEIEYEPKTSNRTHLSADFAARENQFRFLNWSAFAAFDEAGIRLPDAQLDGDSLVPYRRKGYTETHSPELKRVNKVMARIQDGILRLRLDGSAADIESEDTWLLVGELLIAINEFDYPKIAEIADKHAGVRQALHDVLGITDDELLAMMCLDSDEWHLLGEENAVFTRYYRQRNE